MIIPMNITIDIILREISNNEPQSYCALTLDTKDPELMEKIKDHIDIFRTIVERKHEMLAKKT